MNNSSMISTIFSNPAIYVCAGTVVVGDQMLVQEPNLVKSLCFGAAVAAGAVGGLYFAQSQKNDKSDFKDPMTKFKDSLMTLRIDAIAGGAASGLLVNNLLLNKPFQFYQLPLIAASVLIAEKIQTQYTMGQLTDRIG